MKEENSTPSVIREFGLSTFAVNNRTVVFILALMLSLGGFFTYTSMPRESFPEVVIPTIYVGTTYPGNSPSDIENLITRPIEKEINTISGVDKITSTSVQDYSTIIVEFEFDVDVDKALREVKDAVDRAKKDLPSDLDQDPNVFELDFSEFPVMNVNLSGDMPIDYLKEYAEYLQDEIEKLPEISEAEIKGVGEKEVRIDIDVFKMNALKISFSDIESAIANENRNISGGELLTDGVRRTLRVVGEFKDVNEINDIIVKHEQGDVVFLKDIGTVSFVYKETESYARSRDLPVVSLDVKKRSGENLINAADKIQKIIQRAREKKFPENLHITITNDQSKRARLAVSNLENNIISGVILVVFVLQLFMGLRNAIFVGIAIPLSMLISVLLLGAAGVTLNMMVLFGLILSLGMLVDNGIVVVENTYRLMEEGLSPLRAAKEGVGEVAYPIITSTLTTLAAFSPLLFWNDLMGEFMKYLPITLITSLSASLFVALVINPVLTARFMKVQAPHHKVRYRPLIISLIVIVVIMAGAYLARIWIIGNLMVWVILITLFNVFILSRLSLWFQEKILSRIERLYTRTLRFAVTGYRPVLLVVGTFMLLVFSIILVGLKKPDITFFPVNEPQYVNIFIEMPQGTDIEKTNELTLQIQQKVYEALADYESIVEAIITNVGAGTSDPIEGPSMAVTPHKAKITVSFVDYEFRNGISTSMVMEKIRDNLRGFPGARITIAKNRMGPPVGKEISIEVSGEDYPRLIALAEGIKSYIESYNIPGIEELKLDLETGKPELLIHVDRGAARRYGLSTGQIGMAIRTALFGKEVSKFKQGEDDFPIMVRLNEDSRHSLSSILNQHITFRDQSSGKLVSIPISAVATIEYTSALGSIKRKNLNRVITIFSNVIGGYNATAINDKIKQALKTYELPPGYSIKFTGEQEEQAKTQQFLTTAFLIAVFLVFLIIVAQFNALHSPIIIMISVLFSTIGVFLGIAIFDMDIVILMTGIGIISLAGIVVNNAIVLMDYINLIRTRRRKELGLNGQRLPYPEIIESIVKGGTLRLRPVLLTAITTVLGLIPLAIGLNINFITLLQRWDPQIYIGGDNVVFWGPMSWTIIFGLTFSTFLTLIIVPVMYLLFDAAQYWLEKQWAKAGHELAGEEG
ncbi:MAG: copper transporter [Chitinophagales bacterium]|nr:MAG: copper transporter [Chitinophagales bacterium]